MPDRLADTILADGRARAATRIKHETEHADRRRRTVEALRVAVGPDADTGPVAAFGKAIAADPAELAAVLRELLVRELAS